MKPACRVKVSIAHPIGVAPYHSHRDHPKSVDTLADERVLGSNDGLNAGGEYLESLD
ncbi:MAG: hypothetical protein OXC67_06890 [Flavobacteriaceae bacterium]|nr:hypothetical protein [Flavobacteriaceae bacterium]